MRVLMCNNFHYFRGGDCTYMFSLADLLQQHGHEVIFFSMHHPDNIACPQSRYFVDYINYRDLVEQKSLRAGIQVLARSIYSIQARSKLKALIDDLHPDIAHFHNIHAHLTPSILAPLRHARIPVVWTLHDYKLLCPEDAFLSHGVICEKCKGQRFYRCALNRCKKDSLAASVMATVEAYAHQWLHLPACVFRFIAPSHFLHDKFLEFGWPSEKVTHIRNFLPHFPAQPARVTNGYGLYIGGLVALKGIHVLIEALVQCGDPSFHIVGEGPEAEALKAQVAAHGLKNTLFKGRLQGKTLQAEISGAQYGVLPSICYENCPYAVMELMAAGKPVIASRLGGIPELIEDGQTGICVEPGNAEELGRKISELTGSPHEAGEMGGRARRYAQKQFSPEEHYKKITKLYGTALSHPTDH